MLLQQHYADKCGIQLPENPPKFETTYHPIPGRYITLSPKTGQPSKNYSHWPEVIQHIQPILHYHQIYIVQLGDSEESPILGCVPKMGISFRESAFLVENSLLHLSGDSCFVHFAGLVKTPIIALYGATLPEATGPYYRGEFKALRGNKGLPSFRAKESEPEIDNILPETVSNAVFETLGLKERINIETICIGKSYHSKQVTFIPDYVPNFQRLAGANLGVRLDVVHNENVVVELLKYRTKPLVLVCKEHPSKDFLNAARGKVSMLFQKFGENYSVEKLKDLKGSGIPYSLIWTGPKDLLGDVRLELLDYQPVGTEKTEVDERVGPDTWFKTGQLFLGRGKTYSSLWHYNHEISTQSGHPAKVGGAYKSEEFWQSKDAFNFFREVKSN
jgi:hypothetical protein